MSDLLELSFCKMEGAGNDFVVLSGAPPSRADLTEMIVWLCDRRRGVGADGVLWMERLTGPGPVFRMHFFNNDGGRANLCLNGGRCVARRAVDLGWTSDRFSFRTEQGVVEAEVSGDTISLAVDMPVWRESALKLPADAPAQRGHWLDTGDPHLVVELTERNFVQLDMPLQGARLRRFEGLGSAGANVHFVWRESADHWRIRSFERGIEGETLACGSGCISAYAALHGELPAIEFRTAGGDRIRVSSSDGRLRLSGPARSAYFGNVQWKSR